MDEMTGVPGSVMVLWWGALVLTVLVVVPLAIYLLHRTWRAAREIQRYTEEALEAGAGIAGNVSHLTKLNDTVEVGARIGEKAGAAREATGQIGALLHREA